MASYPRHSLEQAGGFYELFVKRFPPVGANSARSPGGPELGQQSPKKVSYFSRIKMWLRGAVELFGNCRDLTTPGAGGGSPRRWRLLRKICSDCVGQGVAALAVVLVFTSASREARQGNGAGFLVVVGRARIICHWLRSALPVPVWPLQGPNRLHRP